MDPLPPLTFEGIRFDLDWRVPPPQAPEDDRAHASPPHHQPRSPPAPQYTPGASSSSTHYDFQGLREDLQGFRTVIDEHYTTITDRLDAQDYRIGNIEASISEMRSQSGHSRFYQMEVMRRYDSVYVTRMAGSVPTVPLPPGYPYPGDVYGPQQSYFPDVPPPPSRHQPPMPDDDDPTGS